jgi:hypothetical protein
VVINISQQQSGNQISQQQSCNQISQQCSVNTQNQLQKGMHGFYFTKY